MPTIQSNSITNILLKTTVALVFCSILTAQEIKITTDHPNALYAIEEKAVFTVHVEKPAVGICKVELSLDGGTVLDQTEHNLTESDSFKVSGRLFMPGFLRCVASVNQKKGMAAAGYEPEKIKPGIAAAPDFKNFWDDGMARQTAIEKAVKLIPVPDADENLDSFKIAVTTINGNTIYGFISIPKEDGPFPCAVFVPGASGIVTRPFSTEGVISWLQLDPADSNSVHRAANTISLAMNVHSIDPAQNKEKLREQRTIIGKRRYENMMDRDRYFYREGILAVNAAIDFIAEMKKYDGQHMVFHAQSQGGALALICAGLNKHITAVVARVPALCDHGGYKLGRQAGWPNFVARAKQAGYDEDSAVKMSSYFDTVNFARFIKAPVLIVVGFIDITCSPSSVYSAYNVISAPKQIHNAVMEGHNANDMPVVRAFMEKHLSIP